MEMNIHIAAWTLDNVGGWKVLGPNGCHECGVGSPWFIAVAEAWVVSIVLGCSFTVNGAKATLEHPTVRAAVARAKQHKKGRASTALDRSLEVFAP